MPLPLHLRMSRTGPSRRGVPIPKMWQAGHVCAPFLAGVLSKDWVNS